MRKFILPVAALVVASCCTPSLSRNVYHPKVVLLSSIHRPNLGSGVVIADGWILTAAHNLPMTHADGLTLGEAIQHPYLDIALIPCEGAKSNGLKIATELPRLHDPLRVYGYWLGRQLQRTDGYQSHIIGQMSTPVIPGCSGGAVVNAQGELVGIVKNIGFIGVHDRRSGGYDSARGVVVPQIAGYTLITSDVLGWISMNVNP